MLQGGDFTRGNGTGNILHLVIDLHAKQILLKSILIFHLLGGESIYGAKFPGKLSLFLHSSTMRHLR